MSRDTLYRNDVRFTDWAGSLSPTDWARDSLCADWTNHDVLAHLVIGCSVAPTKIAGAMLAHRGSFDRANTDLARQLAGQRSPTELLDDYRRLSREPHGIGRVFPSRLLLGDHVIHELDICFALGMPSTIDADGLVAVLNTQVRVPNPFVPAAARARDLRLRATDLDWRHGNDGPEVTGTGAQLTLALAGRRHVTRDLHGDGVEILGARL